jgi:hypothetical protein
MVNSNEVYFIIGSVKVKATLQTDLGFASGGEIIHKFCAVSNLSV